MKFRRSEGPLHSYSRQERVREFSQCIGVRGSNHKRRANMYVSTLQDFLKALGGELRITAKFPEGTVEITQLGDVKKAAAAND